MRTNPFVKTYNNLIIAISTNPAIPTAIAFIIVHCELCIAHEQTPLFAQNTQRMIENLYEYLFILFVMKCPLMLYF